MWCNGPMRPTPDTDLSRDPLPLRGKNVLVTGVSRQAGIGYATACRMAAYGASVFCHHFAPHDREQPWGADDISLVLRASAATWSVTPGSPMFMLTCPTLTARIW